MCTSPQSNWLNTIAVRAQYILPILKLFPWRKPKKPGGGLRKNTKIETSSVVFLSFGEDPLNWQNVIEIGEIACSTTAWCSRGHTLKLCFECGITLFLACDTSL